MKKLIIIFLLLATSCFAQIEGEGLDHGKLGLNKISGGNPGTTAIDSVAWVKGSGSTITDRMKDTYPVLYALKRLWSGASDSCLILRRSFDNAELSFGYVNGILDTASVRSWLDTAIFYDDFTSDVTGWAGVNSTPLHYTSDYNSVGRINVLLDTITTTSVTVWAFASPVLDAVPLRITYDYYIPSSNSHVDGLKVRLGGQYGDIQNTVNSWTSVTEFISSDGSDYVRFVAYDGVAIGGVAGNVFYVDNVLIQEVLPFPGYNPIKNNNDYNPK